MSNIFEALQLAEKQRTVVAPEELPVEIVPEKTRLQQELKAGEKANPQQLRLRSASHSVERELLTLYQNIDYCLQDIPQRVVQFIGSREGEGVSTVVGEFARLMGVVLGKSVLIVDAAHRNPTQHIHFNIDHGYGWREVLDSGEPFEKAVYKASIDNVFLSPLVPHTCLSPQVYNDEATINLLTELKKKFDLILIDSSPATTSPDSIAISRNVDGVVLVVEAERTRWPVVEQVKEKILKNGGNILGVVLNKRRHYIPEAIYQRL